METVKVTVKLDMRDSRVPVWCEAELPPLEGLYLSRVKDFTPEQIGGAIRPIAEAIAQQLVHLAQQQSKLVEIPTLEAQP